MSWFVWGAKWRVIIFISFLYSLNLSSLIYNRHIPVVILSRTSIDMGSNLQNIQQYCVLVWLCPVSVGRLWFIQVNAKFLVFHSCESQVHNVWQHCWTVLPSFSFGCLCFESWSTVYRVSENRHTYVLGTFKDS